MKRKVIRIDESKCTGCGLCIPNCPEGALQIIDGKARLVSDLFCDGLGACIGTCPEGAITIEEREAEPYDESKVMENIIRAGKATIKAHLEHLRDHAQHKYLEEAMEVLRSKGLAHEFEHLLHSEPHEAGGCPGSATVDFRSETHQVPQESGERPSQLGHWPVQLQLVHPNAPYFEDCDLIIAADCVPFAYAGFHERFLHGKSLIIFCPKLDRMPEQYVEKLSEIFSANTIRSITLVHMEVPCCFGLTGIVKEAIKRSGKNLPIKEETISIRGAVLTEAK